MGKIILTIPITLDGYIEGPHRELDWVIADDELHDFFTSTIENGELLLFGRVAYELLANYWPSATSDPTLPAGMARFVNAINPMPKIVYSKTLQNPGWNTQVRREFDPDEIFEMKALAGKDILLSGGASIAQTFMHHGLVDEYHLAVHPITIGNGKSLFSNLYEMQKLTLLWSKPFQSGVIALGYKANGNY